MKKLVYFIASVSFFCFFIIGCNKDNVSIDKISVLNSAKIEDSPIANAEKELGKLQKKDFTYTDEKTGSIFVLRIAARTTAEIQTYLEENEITFFGITEERRLALLKDLKNNSPSKVAAPSNENSSDYVENVITELVSKKLGVGVTGIGQTLSSKISNSTSNKNARPSGVQSVDWKTPSIPWCEKITIATINESPLKSSPAYFQVRGGGYGLFWNGSGVSFATLSTNGSSTPYNSDGPKFTRIGVDSDFYNKFTVTWLDLESGETETK